MTAVPDEPTPDAYPAKKPIVSRPMTPIEKRMSEDLWWAAEAPEVQQHTGKLVAVRNKRVIAVGTDQDEVLARAAAAEQCPEWEFVIEAVPALDFWDTPK